MLVRHGYPNDADRDALATLPGRSYDQLRTWLADHPTWEGIVFHDGVRMAKIKRRDFGAS